MNPSRICRFAGLVLATMIAASCTMKDQDAPPLTGPSEFGTSVNVSVSPDILTGNGASQSVVTVVVLDSAGQPLANQPMRVEIRVDGQTVDFGSTPEAPPDERDRGSTPGEPQGPVFGIVAIGDHPTGYFDDVEVAPGSSIELTVAIMNQGEVAVSLHTYKMNALSGANGGFLSGNEADPAEGATAWIDYPSFDLDVAPGEQQTVTFTVTVPSDAAPGQYVSGLAVTMRDAEAISGSVFSQVRSYAISVGILVPGEITHSFALGEPQSERPFLRIPITNTGNYLVRPSGDLSLTDMSGNPVHTSTLEMGSIYAGLSTIIEVALPDQTPPGEYVLNVALTDEASGATAEIADVPVTVSEPVDPAGVSATVSIEPNADPIAFANASVTILNGGAEIPAANVSLTVLRDGEKVEDYPLANNVILPTGETVVTGRYIPADAWTPGTYTFQVTVSSVNQRDGSDTVLLTIAAADSIVVP